MVTADFVKGATVTVAALAGLFLGFWVQDRVKLHLEAGTPKSPIAAAALETLSRIHDSRECTVYSG